MQVGSWNGVQLLGCSMLHAGVRSETERAICYTR